MNNPLSLKIMPKGFKHFDVNPKYNDFIIKKVRDRSQIFVMQTIASGNMDFYCEDYKLLKDYAGQEIKAQLTEHYCEEKSFTYDCYLNLSNSYDFGLKKISGNIEIKDRYWYLFNEKKENGFDNSINLMIRYSGINNFINVDNRVALIQSFELHSVLQYLIGLITDEIKLDFATLDFQYDLNLEKLFLTSIKNIIKYEPSGFLNFADLQAKEISFSLKSILDLIRNKFFSGFYIEKEKRSGQDFYFLQIKYFEKAGLFYNNIDLTDIEAKKDKNILLLNEQNQAIIKYNTFQYDESKMSVASEDFATANVIFNKYKNSKTINVDDVNSDISQIEFDDEKKCLFEVQISNNDIDLADFSTQFFNDENYPFEFADGDFDKLILNSVIGRPSVIWFPSLRYFSAISKIKVEFDCNISHATDLFLSAGVNDVERKQVQPGANTHTFTTGGAFTNPTISIRTDGTGFTGLEFTNVKVTIFDISNYFELKNNSEATAPKFLVKNFGAELNDDVATIDENDYNVKSVNKFQQKINFDFQDTINNFDEWGLVKTSLGWLRCDEISRKYNNNGHSLCSATLTGK